jgi:hypothetical protein
MSDQEILDEIRRLSEKMDRIAAVLGEMRAERQASRKSRAPKPKPAPLTADEIDRYQTEFAGLYEQWLAGDELGVHSKMDKLDAEELRRFADANNLNVTSKMAKERVLQLIGARFREKKQLHQVRAPRPEAS